MYINIRNYWCFGVYFVFMDIDWCVSLFGCGEDY